MSYVRVDTNYGSFTLELYTQEVPNTVAAFMSNVQRGYFNNTTFPRVDPGFMIQSERLRGVAPPAAGRKPTESPMSAAARKLKHTGAGIVGSLASNGAGFFITLAPTPWLDGKHTVFGRVYTGMRVIERIGNAATDPQNKPLEPITISEISVLE